MTDLPPITPPPAGTDTPRTSKVFDHFPVHGATVPARINLARGAMAGLELELADVTNALAIATRSADEQMRYKWEAEAQRDGALKERNEARSKQPINTHIRLRDLVRYARAELHQSDLITDQEYADLCIGTNADRKFSGSPSPRRLEDYDDMRKELACLRSQLTLAEGAAHRHEKALKEIAAQKSISEMTAHDYEEADFELGYDMCIQSARNVIASITLSTQPHDHDHLSP